MQSEKFKVTPLERSWILYDVGNSAFVLMIATLMLITYVPAISMFLPNLLG